MVYFESWCSFWLGLRCRVGYYLPRASSYGARFVDVEALIGPINSGKTQIDSLLERGMNGIIWHHLHSSVDIDYGD